MRCLLLLLTLAHAHSWYRHLLSDVSAAECRVPCNFARGTSWLWSTAFGPLGSGPSLEKLLCLDDVAALSGACAAK